MPKPLAGRERKFGQYSISHLFDHIPRRFIILTFDGTQGGSKCIQMTELFYCTAIEWRKPKRKVSDETQKYFQSENYSGDELNYHPMGYQMKSKKHFEIGQKVGLGVVVTFGSWPETSDKWSYSFSRLIDPGLARCHLGRWAAFSDTNLLRSPCNCTPSNANLYCLDAGPG